MKFQICILMTALSLSLVTFGSDNSDTTDSSDASEGQTITPVAAPIPVEVRELPPLAVPDPEPQTPAQPPAPTSATSHGNDLSAICPQLQNPTVPSCLPFERIPTQEEHSRQGIPLALPPVQVTERPRAEGPDILIVTDQASAAKACELVQAFRNTSPFSAMNLTFEIVKLSRAELDCRPDYDSKNLLKCFGSGRSVAKNLRLQRNARIDITVVEMAGETKGAATWRDNSGRKSTRQHQSLMNTAANPMSGVHESLHIVGYKDEYPVGSQGEALPPVAGGTLMNWLGGNIPTQRWESIANFYGVAIPTVCTPN